MREEETMISSTNRRGISRALLGVALLATTTVGLRAAAEEETSYMPVVITESFETTLKRMSGAKQSVMKRQMGLLAERYDLSNRSAKGVTMSRGKAIQEGIRVKLPGGTSWEQLAAMTLDEIRQKGALPKGFLPLPHPHHAEGGMVFPAFHIDEIKRQEGRDLTRFDLDYDLPDHFLPEFPPPIHLTTRPDLGDVSKVLMIT
jgi:cytochrome c peroxidase